MRGGGNMEIRERLAKAFESLEKDGFIARMDWKCCQTCGWSAIADEVERADYPVKGAVFLHSQDADDLLERGRVYLSYGSINGDEEEDRKVGAIVCSSLKENGLDFEWNGDPSKRILVFEREE